MQATQFHYYCFAFLQFFENFSDNFPETTPFLTLCEIFMGIQWANTPGHDSGMRIRLNKTAR